MSVFEKYVIYTGGPASLLATLFFFLGDPIHALLFLSAWQWIAIMLGLVGRPA